MTFLRNACVVAFCLFSSVVLADPFVVTLSSNGDSRTYSYDSVESAIDTFSNSSLEQLLPSYTAGSAATAQIDLRGLPVTLSFAAASNTLTLNIPGIGVVRNFTGASRNASKDLLVDFFQGQGGQSVLTQILQALAARTPIDPVAGNPNSLLARMGDRDFERGTDYREGFNIAAYQDNRNEFGLGADTGWYSNDIADQKVTSADLSYTRHMSDHNASFLVDMPLSYTQSEGAESYSASLGVGLRKPLTNQWAVTPIVRAGGIGSKDLGAAAVIYSGSVTSDLRLPLSKNNEFQLGNMVGYYKTDGITVGDYSIDYNLSNVRFKNGVALAHRFENLPLAGRVFFNDSRFTGDELFNDSYEEVGFSIIKPYSKLVSAQLGASYLFADGYNGVKLNLDVRF